MRFLTIYYRHSGYLYKVETKYNQGHNLLKIAILLLPKLAPKVPIVVIVNFSNLFLIELLELMVVVISITQGTSFRYL